MMLSEMGGADDDEIFNLTLHLDSFPSDQLLNVNTPAAIFDYFMNMLKEVCLIRLGSTQAYF